MAVSILIYQHLDNIDGKQARKTSTILSLCRFLQSSGDALWPWIRCSHCFLTRRSGHEDMQAFLWLPIILRVRSRHEFVLLRNVEPILSWLLQAGSGEPCWWRTATLCALLLNGNSNRLYNLPHLGDIRIVVNVLAVRGVHSPKHLHGERYHEEQDNPQGVDSIYPLALRLLRHRHSSSLPLHPSTGHPCLLFFLLLHHVHVEQEYDQHPTSAHHEAKVPCLQSRHPIIPGFVWVLRLIRPCLQHRGLYLLFNGLRDSGHRVFRVHCPSSVRRSHCFRN